MSDPIETTYPIYNQYIYKDGIGWVLVGGGGGGGSSLPDQTDNAGKFLTTDGTDTSWATISIPVTSVNGQTGDVTITDSDEKVKTVNYSTADNTAHPIVFGNSTSATETKLASTDLSFLKSDQNNQLYSTLTIGTAANQKGRITLNTGRGNSGEWTDLIGSATSSSKTITFPNATGTVALTSDIPSVPSWALESTKPTYTASEVGALPDTTDVTKWNGVSLAKQSSTYGGNNTYVPATNSLSPLNMSFTKYTYTPTANAIAKYDTNSYLYSTTPSASDNSTKVATTAYVDSAINELGSLLTFKGVIATTGDLPGSGNDIGDVWIVTADSSEHVWNGTAWEEFGPTIDLSGYATLNSPAFTGTPTAPTPTASSGNTQIATKEYVDTKATITIVDWTTA